MAPLESYGWIQPPIYGQAVWSSPAWRAIYIDAFFGSTVPAGSCGAGWSYSPAASGSTARAGSGSCGHLFAASASGVRTPVGSSSPGFVFVASGSGASPRSGEASTSIGWAGSADGVWLPVGDAVAAFVYLVRVLAGWRGIHPTIGAASSRSGRARRIDPRPTPDGLTPSTRRAT